METVNGKSNTEPREDPTPVEEPAPSLEVQQSWKIDRRLLDKAAELLRGRESIRVLEAGCGAHSHFAFSGKLDIDGIDISQEELDKNRDVHHKMRGDIQTYPLPPSYYDVVVCWDVIEHLPRPYEALNNMFCSVKPDGLIVLGFPNLMSFKGLATKATPLWIHRLLYRSMRSNPGYNFQPFKTYLRWDILPWKVLKLAAENGFATELFDLEEGAVQKSLRTRAWPAGMLFYLIQICIDVLSLGRGPSLYLDSCMMILRKQG
jgi:SAM-dependent methyltransferase